MGRHVAVDSRGRPINERAMRLLELPLETLTYDEIALLVGAGRKTCRTYMTQLRQAGLTTAIPRRKDYPKSKKPPMATKEMRDRIAAAREEAERKAREALFDPRQVICRTTWNTYAMVLTPEDMEKNFILKRELV
jgi:transposase